MKNTIINKIKLLKDIKPDPAWLKSQRDNLLLEISESGKKTKRVWNLPVFLVPKFAFKPVLISCLVLGLIFSGGLLVVQASKNSLPGDLLYSVKISLENTKMKISDQASKPELEAEFVNNRAEELSQIIEEVDDPIEKKKKVVKAVNKLQAQVVSVKTRLDQVKIDEPEKAAEITDKVSEKLTEAKGNIERVSDPLAIILNDKGKAQEIMFQMEIVEFNEPLEVEEPIITSPNSSRPINKASKSFEDLENKASESFEDLENKASESFEILEDVESH